MSSDRDVVVRSRSDGLTELSPRRWSLGLEERWMILSIVVIAAWGFFLAGALPAALLAVILTVCLFVDLAIGARGVFFSALRPPGKVIPVARFSRTRRPLRRD